MENWRREEENEKEENNTATYLTSYFMSYLEWYNFDDELYIKVTKNNKYYFNLSWQMEFNFGFCDTWYLQMTLFRLMRHMKC